MTRSISDDSGPMLKKPQPHWQAASLSEPLEVQLEVPARAGPGVGHAVTVRKQVAPLTRRFKNHVVRSRYSNGKNLKFRRGYAIIWILKLPTYE
jgi:hypothetical protein